MTDLPRTARYALPLLALAQAQKEVTHNEALTLIDALVHATIEAGPVAAPPASPANGQCWLVGAGASGEWAEHAHMLAIWTAGGWRFVMPRAGLRLLRLTDGALLRFDDGIWVAPSPVAAPAGGATVDIEARSAIVALIALLDAHGILIAG